MKDFSNDALNNIKSIKTKIIIVIAFGQASLSTCISAGNDDAEEDVPENTGFFSYLVPLRKRH